MFILKVKNFCKFSKIFLIMFTCFNAVGVVIKNLWKKILYDNRKIIIVLKQVVAKGKVLSVLMVLL